jgi:D-arabinose 1-dehydrogenase-like Zn-dependent alcohol dehydrogenase
MGIELVLDDPGAREIARTLKLSPRGAGFAIALDGIATEQSLAHALPALRDGGRYVLAGLDPERHVDLNAYPDVHRRDLEIVSPMHSLGDLDVGRMFRFALQLADQGRLRLDGLLDSNVGWRTEVRHTY